MSNVIVCRVCGGNAGPHIEGDNCGNPACDWWLCKNSKCKSFGDARRSVDRRKENEGQR